MFQGYLIRSEDVQTLWQTGKATIIPVDNGDPVTLLVTEPLGGPAWLRQSNPRPDELVGVPVADVCRRQCDRREVPQLAEGNDA